MNIAKHIGICAVINDATPSDFGGIDISDIPMPRVTKSAQLLSTSEDPLIGDCKFIGVSKTNNGNMETGELSRAKSSLI